MNIVSGCEALVILVARVQWLERNSNYQMAAVKPIHWVCHEVNPTPWGFGMQEPVELLHTQSNHHNDNDLNADDLAWELNGAECGQ